MLLLITNFAITIAPTVKYYHKMQKRNEDGVYGWFNIY